MLHYLLQILLFQLIFLIVYDVFHKKDTFFNWNRIYLLSAPFLTLTLPFIELDFLGSGATELYVSNIERTIAASTKIMTFDISNSDPTSTESIFKSINWWIVIYTLGILIGIVRLIFKFHKLHILKNFSHISRAFDKKIVMLPNSTHAFSFWNTVFLGDALTEEEKKYIISHELVHVNHKHTIDQICMEILKIVLWWNPLIYIYQARITILHEYIADSITIHQVNQRAYIEQLLNAAFQTEKITFINQFFNQSLIKKRILMLQKSQSKSIAKFKYLLLIPVLTGILTYTSCNEDSVVPEKSNSTQEKGESDTNKNNINEPTCLNKDAKYDYNLDNYLKIVNGNNTNIIAKLILTETNEVIRTAVIYRSQTHFIRNIPEGMYRTDLVYGEEYLEKETNGTCVGGFKKDILSETGEDILDYNTETTDQGKNVPSYALNVDLLPEELRKNQDHTAETITNTGKKRAEQSEQEMLQKATDLVAKNDNLSLPSRISKEKAELACANKGASKFDMNLDNYLKITNGKGAEIIVDIVNLKTSESVRTIHLPKDTQYYVRNIPEGEYNLEIVYGIGLEKKNTNGTCKLSFANKMAEESGSDKLDFNTIRTSDGINVPSYSITIDVSDLKK